MKRPLDDQDPLPAALDAAEDDDETYTPEQQAAAEEGRQEYQRGEGAPLIDIRRRLLGEADLVRVEGE